MTPRHRFNLAAGLALCAALGAPLLASSISDASIDADDGEIEREITMAEVPDAARKTILNEASGHAIVEVEEVTRGDVVYYEAEWLDGDFEVDVLVSVDGVVIEREREPADDEDENDD